MAPGTDPLGKRALYWTSADSQALVDDTADPSFTTDAGTGPFGALSGSGTRAAGKHALFLGATPEDRTVDDAPTGTVRRPTAGPIAVSCSSCGSSCRVGVVEFLRLQFPFGAWLPRRRFDRWMTCPACQQRTWTSVTLSR